MDTDASNNIGFIILRHVNSEATNKYWIHCHECIRKFYPENPILIIDDNSNYSFISEETFSNTRVIQSEFPKRGELLPYYYYLHNPFADSAVILHELFVRPPHCLVCLRRTGGADAQDEKFRDVECRRDGAKVAKEGARDEPLAGASRGYNGGTFELGEVSSDRCHV